MNIEFLNLLKSSQEGGLEKKNRGDETIRVIIHICMEIAQGNAL
jgi:hypothetical protein